MSEYSTLSVVALRLSESGKAIEVMDMERPEGDRSFWIPVSQCSEESLAEIDFSAMGEQDLEVATWLAEKEGWV